MKIELIVCDWEGCVVDPGGGTVAWDTHTIATLSDLINRLRSRQEGPAFVLCTGRQFSYGEAALQATNAFWDDLPSIFENGAGFYYPRTKRYIWNPAITDETERLKRKQVITPSATRSRLQKNLSLRRPS